MEASWQTNPPFVKKITQVCDPLHDGLCYGCRQIINIQQASTCKCGQGFMYTVGFSILGEITSIVEAWYPSSRVSGGSPSRMLKIH